MLKVKSKKYKELELDGTVIQLAVPSALQLNEYQKKVKEKEDSGGDVFPDLLNLLVKCGMDAEVLKVLDSESILAITEYLAPSKKK